MQPQDARSSEIAPAKINLALHIRGRMPDGRHALETLFAFCTDGDRLWAEPSQDFALSIDGPFGPDLDTSLPTSVEAAAERLARAAGVPLHARMHLEKNLPIASGIGGGSADAAAALRLLTSMWRIDPAHAAAVAPELGADVPACLLSMTARGEGAGDALRLVESAGIAGAPILLVNPLIPLSTGEVFARWDGVDRGSLGDDWRQGRNDLEAPARGLVPEIGAALFWLGERDGVTFVRMSGSGATCFALFDNDGERDKAAASCPPEWWHLASTLR